LIIDYKGEDDDEDESNMRTNLFHLFQVGGLDGGPSTRSYIDPLTKVIVRRLKEEEEPLKTLLLLSVYFPQYPISS